MSSLMGGPEKNRRFQTRRFDQYALIVFWKIYINDIDCEIILTSPRCVWEHFQ